MEEIIEPKLQKAAEKYAHDHCRSCNDRNTEEGCTCGRLEAAYLTGASKMSAENLNDGHIVDMLFADGFIDPLKIEEAKKRIPVYPKPSRVPPEERGSADKYKHCNHHHVIDENHELLDLGDGEFVANIQAIPLLKALNEAGLKTRTHHIGKENHAFISILLDNATVEIKKVFEKDATRTKYNGKFELLIQWDK